MTRLRPITGRRSGHSRRRWPCAVGAPLTGRLRFVLQAQQAARVAVPVGLISLLPTMTSCSTAAEETGAGLIDFAQLTPTRSARDPLASHRPMAIDCNGLDGWFLEDGALEVDTGSCNYFSVSAPTLVSAPKGAVLTTELSYFDLNAAAPAEAHLALTLDDETLWETHLPVPSEAAVRELEITLPSDVQLGARIGIHLHNHGQNTYRFQPLWVSLTLDNPG